MKRLLLLYITFLFLTGCETTQDVDFPDIKPKLVVNCLFNPDSVFLVHISHNASIVDYDINTYDAFGYIENAEIRIYENNTYIGQLTDAGKGFYLAENVYPVANAEYRIKVNAGGYDGIWAESIVPANIELDTFIWNRQRDPISELGEVFKVNMVWRDPPGEDYYYLYNLKSTSDNPYSYSNPDLFVKDCPLFPDVARPDMFIFNDHLFEGDTMNLECYCDLGYLSSMDTTYFAFYLAHVSKEFYQWALTLVEHNAQRRYFSEPVQVYSNIQNGLGLFAGYNTCGDTIAYTWFDFKKGGEMK